MSEQSKDNKILTRRDFIKLGTGTLASAALTGCALPIFGDKPKAPLSKETRSGEKIIWQKNRVIVWGSESENLPTRWQDATGNQGIFDKKTIANGLQELRTDKKRWQAVLATQRVIIQETVVLPKTENPKIIDLPNDISSKEELLQRGIEIIDSPKVALHVRRAAFSQGNLLDYFVSGGRNKISVIIADYPVLHRNAFADKVYDFEREAINRIFKLSDMDDPQKRKEYLIRDLKASTYDRPEIAERKIKAGETLTSEEIVKWGLYVTTTAYYLNQGHELALDKAYLFLAFGDRPRKINCLNLIGHQDGTITPELFAFDLQENLGLFPPRKLGFQQSYPKPQDFRLMKEITGLFGKKSSPAVEPEDKTPGFVARHEFSHGYRVNHMADTDPKDVWNEWETDLDAHKSIEQAYSLFKSGDDSGYYFVLENKQEKYFVAT